jgi:hypothetical protein
MIWGWFHGAGVEGVARPSPETAVVDVQIKSRREGEGEAKE